MSSIFRISLKHMPKMNYIPKVKQNMEGTMTQLERSQASFNVEM